MLYMLKLLYSFNVFDDILYILHNVQIIIQEDSVALDQTGSHASDGDVPVRKMGQRKSARWSSSKSLLVSEPKRRSLSKHGKATLH